MTLTQKRLLILLIIAAAAFVLGRLAVRAFMNLLVGGTLFGRLCRFGWGFWYLCWPLGPAQRQRF